MLTKQIGKMYRMHEEECSLNRSKKATMGKRPLSKGREVRDEPCR